MPFRTNKIPWKLKVIILDILKYRLWFLQPMTTSIFVGLVKITVLRIRKFLVINLRLMLIDLNIKKLHLIEMIWSGMNLSCFGIEGINFVKNHSFKDWSSLGQLIVPCIQYVIRNCTSIHEHFISWLKST